MELKRPTSHRAPAPPTIMLPPAVRRARYAGPTAYARLSPSMAPLHTPERGAPTAPGRPQAVRQSSAPAMLPPPRPSLRVAASPFPLATAATKPTTTRAAPTTPSSSTSPSRPSSQPSTKAAPPQP
ncbi:hypothetical protein FH972_025181 [Carpinus fangiana]|uniref:Uncharacterized protein n=1 Tax=Carpinus fangiana TaxID=176857 RepID=A0A5N6L2U7_9ROSI|nr:hypothetical protein FH972_025181 [Carpinus fangiana]